MSKTRSQRHVQRRRAPSNGFISPYYTYLFKDKDPIIGILQTFIIENARGDNETLTKILARIAAGTGVSYTTLSAWFFGKTVRPQHATLEAVARFYGKTLNNLTDVTVTERRALRSIAGGKR